MEFTLFKKEQEAKQPDSIENHKRMNENSETEIPF